MDDDAWHDTMMRHDQIYGPIESSLDHALSALGADAPAHRRLALTRDFLSFVEDELEEIGAKWETRKGELGY